MQGDNFLDPIGVVALRGFLDTCCPISVGSPFLGSAFLPEFNPIYLREWRKAKGLTLTELGRLAGIDHGNLSRLERGIFPYSQGVLEKLAAALDTSPAIILTFTPAEVAKIEAEIADAGAGSMPLTQEAWQKICSTHKKS